MQITIEESFWPVAGTFSISRGQRNQAHVLTVNLHDGEHCGWAECIPYAHYGETVADVIQQLAAFAERQNEPLHFADIAAARLSPSASNALDCALWDLHARQQQKDICQLIDMPPLRPLLCSQTIPLADTAQMAARAAQYKEYPLLKVKLGGKDDQAAIQAIRAAAPQARLIVDANEGWSPETLMVNFEACTTAGVELIEQPLPAAQDTFLASIPHPIPLCADESFRALSDLSRLKGCYELVNLKLEKTGGLSHGFTYLQAAKAAGFGVMVGCILGTSLAMAPAFVLAQQADYTDLDGPTLLAEDRAGGFSYTKGLMQPANPGFWA